jgi:hypothetical protein
MKLVIGVLVSFWLIAGLIGAWMMDDLDPAHWKLVARGGVTLAEALNDRPVTYPGG